MGRIGDDSELSMPKLDEAVFCVDTVCDMRATQTNGRVKLVVDCTAGSESYTAQRIEQELGQAVDIEFHPLDMRLRKRRIEVQTGA